LAKPKQDLDPTGRSTRNIVYRDVLNWWQHRCVNRSHSDCSTFYFYFLILNSFGTLHYFQDLCLHNIRDSMAALLFLITTLLFLFIHQLFRDSMSTSVISFQFCNMPYIRLYFSPPFKYIWLTTRVLF
jgi:hypothetical protein